MNAPSVESPAKTSGATRYVVLIGALLVQLILGTLYGYSIFWEPLEAEIFPPVITQVEADAKEAAGEDLSRYTVVADEQAAEVERDVHQGYLKYAFSICILTFAIVMVIAGRVQDVRGPRFTAIIGAVLMGGGFLIAGSLSNRIVFYLLHATFIGGATVMVLMIYHAMMGKLNKEEMPILNYVPHGIVATAIVAGVLCGGQYVRQTGGLDRLLMLWGTVGFLAGAGIGFAYVCPIAALIKWFPEKKGFVSGLAVAGFGFGAYLFKGRAFGALGFIEKYDITNFFVLYGLVCLVGIIIGAMLLKNPPGAAQAKKVAADSNWQDTLRQPAFYILWVMYFSGATAGLMVIGIVTGFAGEQLVSAATAVNAAITETDKAELMLRGAKAMASLAIFNAVGRIVWGFVSDKIGRTISFVAMFIFQAMMMLLLAGMKTELTLAVATSIIGFNYGGCFALFPSATADLFGAKNLGVNYGWVFTSYGIAGVVGIAAGNAAKTMTGSYSAAFVLAAILCLISAGLAIWLRVMQKRAAAAAA